MIIIYKISKLEVEKKIVCPDEDNDACLNTNTSCEKVNYIFMGRDNGYYYIILTNGDKVDDIIENKNFNPDTTTNSTIKPTVDNFYANNLTTYNSFIEDTIYCNDRSITDLGGWNPNGGDTNGKEIKFKNDESNQNLICTNETDKFSLSNDLAKLNYPIGLLTVEELYYAGFEPNSNKKARRAPRIIQTSDIINKYFIISFPPNMQYLRILHLHHYLNICLSPSL